MVQMFWTGNYRYSALNGDSKVRTGLVSNWSWKRLAVALFVYLGVVASSFYAGRVSVADRSLLTIPREAPSNCLSPGSARHLADVGRETQ